MSNHDSSPQDAIFRQVKDSLKINGDTATYTCGYWESGFLSGPGKGGTLKRMGMLSRQKFTRDGEQFVTIKVDRSRFAEQILALSNPVPIREPLPGWFKSPEYDPYRQLYKDVAELIGPNKELTHGR